MLMREDLLIRTSQATAHQAEVVSEVDEVVSVAVEVEVLIRSEVVFEEAGVDSSVPVVVEVELV